MPQSSGYAKRFPLLSKKARGRMQQKRKRRR